MSHVQLKKIVTVTAKKVSKIAAALEDGSEVPVTGPINVGDYHITNPDGTQEVLSAADYAAALVPVAHQPV
jgi:hypothetical protein